MEEKYFGNPGKKIKDIAKWIAIIMTVIFVIGGMVLFVAGATNTSEDYFDDDVYADPNWGLAIGGVAIAVVGPVLSYASALSLYAFGQLVQTNEEILANSKKAE